MILIENLSKPLEHKILDDLILNSFNSLRAKGKSGYSTIDIPHFYIFRETKVNKDQIKNHGKPINI